MATKTHHNQGNNQVQYANHEYQRRACTEMPDPSNELAPFDLNNINDKAPNR